MVKINKIYTRTGDEGETGLVGNKRISKDALRVEAYGDVDELNAWLGLCRTLADKSGFQDISLQLTQVQNELFDLGSILATASGESWPGMPNFETGQISRLEGWIDQITAGLEELKSFVLPGGTELNSALHIARTVCRRAERRVVALARNEPAAPGVVAYINRLSDYLFALARHSSKSAKAAEYLWVLGKK